MRFLLLVLLAAACNSDTFDTGDGGDASTDAINASDAITGDVKEASVFDPSMLGPSLALWMDAADAQTGGDASDLVVAWPDHQHKYTTVVEPGGSSQSCTASGIHASKSGQLNNRPVVSFCNSILTVNDAAGLHLGTSPFFIEAVVFTAQAGGISDVLLTKTAQGDSNAFPPSLTLVAPEGNGDLAGSLNSSTIATQVSLESKFHYLGMVRTPSSIVVRIDGQPSNPTAANASDDVSFTGTNLQIGGYRFDIGQLHDMFRGVLAELLIVTDPGHMSEVEFYLKKKYAL